MFHGPYGFSNRSPLKEFVRLDALGWLPRGYLDGGTLSNDGTDATNDIGIAPLVTRSTVRIVNGAASTLSRDQMDLELPVAVIKQLDVAWAPDSYEPSVPQGSGDRSGGRSPSSLADGTWHVYVIGSPYMKPDVLLHDSAVQSSILAALPGNYTAYRRIGSIKRSTSILAFAQDGDKFRLKAGIVTNGSANPGTSAVTFTLPVPTGIVVWADFAVSLSNASSNYYWVATALDETDVAAGSGNFTFHTFGTSNTEAFGNILVKTNTSAQVRFRQDASGASDQTTTVLYGWIDKRGKDA